MEQSKHTSRRAFLNFGAGAAAALGMSALPPLARGASSGRAAVCVYLLGGNDSNNMIVPLDSPAYDTYARGRGALALPADSLLAVRDGASAQYGFHPALGGLRDLYNQNALAVVANVGRTDPGHRLAGDASDYLRELQMRFLPDGYMTTPWAVPGAPTATDSLPVFNLGRGVSLAAPGTQPARHRTLAGDIAAAPLHRNLPATPLARQLNLVLSAIRLGGFSQQCFVVPFEGFATSRDQLNRQAALFAELDRAMVGFYRATLDLGIADRVTIYTDTEFNRTLAPNRAGGSDHAWGGHQLVLGGAALGGRIYGQFPSLAIGGPDDAAGNGTWTPSTSRARFDATLAYWYGVSDFSGIPEYAAEPSAMQNRLDFLTQ
ncbi:MAG: DUF1501 domain-containing protein [Acidobacteria bacterium]|nr:DUF1501 domain-containing protein [Acidobacteriota bacterium]